MDAPRMLAAILRFREGRLFATRAKGRWAAEVLPNALGTLPHVNSAMHRCT